MVGGIEEPAAGLDASARLPLTQGEHNENISKNDKRTSD